MNKHSYLKNPPAEQICNVSNVALVAADLNIDKHSYLKSYQKNL